MCRLCSWRTKESSAGGNLNNFTYTNIVTFYKVFPLKDLFFTYYFYWVIQGTTTDKFAEDPADIDVPIISNVLLFLEDSFENMEVLDVYRPAHYASLRYILYSSLYNIKLSN